jgi:peptide-methionine (S)-S-oxide reductase
MEAVFERLPGITAVIPGYSGGTVPAPTYEQVCTGTTGHAETVKVGFDPERTSLESILETYWKAHDPTSKDRQGDDVGSQYRSIILYADEAQRTIAEESRKSAQSGFKTPIVTEIVKLEEFYPAEEYHRHYFELHPYAGYCRVVIAPKIAKLHFPTA